MFQSFRRTVGLSLLPLTLLAIQNARAWAEPKPSADPVPSVTEWLAKPAADRAALEKQPFANNPLTKDQAEKIRQLLWDDHVAQIKESRKQEWAAGAITVGDKTMKLLARHFGEKPKDGWNLFISMHGGGGAPAEVNDQQWENQIKLYQPKDSLYIAPRAPTNNWNLWHEGHIDDCFDRLIEDAIVLGGVNPNRIYIMGYSAGGDGVYQLAPRMADRLAAASMMAGHPNDASPLGLRNIGFTMHVGALDDGYGRNKVVLEWKKKLDDLQAADPDGYKHEVKLHEGRSHWMNLEDAVAVDWMLGFTRDPIPTRVVWNQTGRTHDRLYWLATPKEEAKGGQLVIASRKGQEITIEKAEGGVKNLTIRLTDAMVNLDQPVTVTMGGKELFKGVAKRTAVTLKQTLDERGDPMLVFDAAVTIKIP